MTVRLNPEDDVFTGDGYLNQSTQLYLGAKSTQHSLPVPPFPQTMYVNGVMTDPWKNFWQQAQTKLNITEAPTDQPFTGAGGKITTDWSTWFQQW